MKQIIRWIKKNKLTVVIIIIFIVLVVIANQLYSLLVPNMGKPIYGNLEGKEEAKVEKEVYETLKKTLESEEMVKKVTIEEGEKLITFIITVTDDTTKETAKSLAPKTLEPFNDVQKDYYNFQIFIQKENEELNDFPISGNKHPKNEGYSWTKDREVTQ